MKLRIVAILEIIFKRTNENTTTSKILKNDLETFFLDLKTLNSKFNIAIWKNVFWLYLMHPVNLNFEKWNCYFENLKTGCIEPVLFQLVMLICINDKKIKNGKLVWMDKWKCKTVTNVKETVQMLCKSWWKKLKFDGNLEVSILDTASCIPS